MNNMLSRRQVSTLRYLKMHGTVSHDELRSLHQGTIWSLLYRKFVLRYGGDMIGLSDLGEVALRDYNSAAPSYRKHDAELTERVQRLLARARVIMIQKTALRKTA